MDSVESRLSQSLEAALRDGLGEGGPMATGELGSRILPAGTVTFLLGDVEGSVRLWEADRQSMSIVAKRLDLLVSEVVEAHGGVRPVEQGEGDSFVLAFGRAAEAVACALALQRATANEPWPGGLDLRIRMALNTGDAQLRDGGNYAGQAINRCARIRALAHGGQTLLSRSTYEVAADHVPDGVTLKDLGEHRLRDLARPERIYQLSHPDLPNDFPSLRSLAALPNNLPQQLTSFIGRQQEMAEITRLIATTRALTLTGAGGSGKTRLAIQVAAELVEVFPGGVWWVELAPVSDPALVPGAVCSVLSMRQVPGEDVAETLARNVGDRRLLIILDNCEHLIAACAALASALLRRCPAVVLLATSREPLGLDGETAYRVPSLPFPDEEEALESVAGYDSVRLFVDRAARARPTFTLTAETAPSVAKICGRLDGIPLALELAAARVRVMSPAQIAVGLSDRFHLLTGGARTALPRQRTLEASVDWSYTLLTDDERAVLARLSVFAGSFSLEAAEQVCAGDAIDRYRVFDLLASLVDRSLVQTEESGDETRYRLLETIRAYARHKLTDAGAAADTRTQHLDHYVSLAERSEPELQGPGLSEWLDRLDRDLANLHVAIDWALTSGQEEKALRIAGSITVYWLVRARYSEVQRLLERALDAATDAEPSVRLKALWSAILVWFTGDFARTRRFAEEMEAIARQVSDRAMLSRAVCWLGWTEFWLGLGPGVEPLEEALRLAREVGEPLQLVRNLQFLGVLVAARGGPSKGLPLFEEAISLARASGNLPGLSSALFFHGMAHWLRGALSESESILQEGLAVARAVNYGMFTAQSLGELGHVALLRGDLQRSRELTHEALRTAREAGTTLGQQHATTYLATLAYAEGDLPGALSRLDDLDRLPGEFLWLTVTRLLLRGDVAFRRGESNQARSYFDASIRAAAEIPSLRGKALVELGRLNRSMGELEPAETSTHEAVRLHLDAEDRLGVVDSLEALAGIACDLESHREAARLFGAADRIRSEVGYVRLPVERTAYEADVARVREMLGPEFRAACDEGAAMSMEEAVSYAQRGRGERKRPSAGWASLTPAEEQIVKLVAEGLTNPQIAERLFITRNTAKVHLQHVFAKLGVATRAELAAEATARGMRA